MFGINPITPSPPLRFPGPAEMFRKTARPYLPSTHASIEKMLSRYFLEYEPEKNPPVNLRPGLTREEYMRAKEDLRGAQASFESERAAILPDIKELETKSSRLGKWGFAVFAAGMAGVVAAIQGGYQEIARALPFFSEPTGKGIAFVASFFAPLLVAMGGFGGFLSKSASHSAKAGIMKGEIAFMRGFLEDTRKHLDAVSSNFR